MSANQTALKALAKEGISLTEEELIRELKRIPALGTCTMPMQLTSGSLLLREILRSKSEMNGAVGVQVKNPVESNEAIRSHRTGQSSSQNESTNNQPPPRAEFRRQSRQPIQRTPPPRPDFRRGGGQAQRTPPPRPDFHRREGQTDNGMQGWLAGFGVLAFIIALVIGAVADHEQRTSLANQSSSPRFQPNAGSNFLPRQPQPSGFQSGWSTSQPGSFGFQTNSRSTQFGVQRHFANPAEIQTGSRGVQRSSPVTRPSSSGFQRSSPGMQRWP
jgi:hypothetical protein